MIIHGSFMVSCFEKILVLIRDKSLNLRSKYQKLWHLYTTIPVLLSPPTAW